MPPHPPCRGPSLTPQGSPHSTPSPARPDQVAAREAAAAERDQSHAYCPSRSSAASGAAASSGATSGASATDAPAAGANDRSPSTPQDLVPLAHAGDDPGEIGLDHAPAHNHLLERGVKGLEVEDQIQLAHVLKQHVERLHEHLDQVQQAQRRLERVRDDDEVQGGVVAVEQGDLVVARVPRVRPAREERRQGEEVARRGRTRRDAAEDLLQQTLLLAQVLVPSTTGSDNEGAGGKHDLGVEFDQTGLAVVVEHQHCVDHVGGVG